MKLTSSIICVTFFALFSLGDGALDPSTATQADIDAVKASWKTASADKEKMGVMLFTNIFKSHPEYEKLFERFKKSGTTLLKSPDFIKHTVKIVDEVTKLLDIVANPAQLEAELKKLGDLHKSKGVKPDSFDNFKKVFEETMVQSGAVKQGSPLEASWDKVGSYILGNLKKFTE